MSRLKLYNNVNKELVLRNNNQDDDDDEEEETTDDDDENNNNNNEPQQQQQQKALELPGGSANITSTISTTSTINSVINSNVVGEIPREITYFIRQYLDHLFGAIILQAQALVERGIEYSHHLIPGVVAEILNYNNITFQNVYMIKTRLVLFEPIWYEYDIHRSELCLYLDEILYDNMCRRRNDLSVMFDGGIITLENFNPTTINPDLPQLTSQSIFNCAIMSDHVAQHIITDIMMGSKKLPGAPLHDQFTRYGTTLHSMFNIERNVIQSNRKEYSNYLTFYDRRNNNSTNNNSLSNLLDLPTAAQQQQQNPSSTYTSRNIIQSILNGTL